MSQTFHKPRGATMLAMGFFALAVTSSAFRSSVALGVATCAALTTAGVVWWGWMGRKYLTITPSGIEVFDGWRSFHVPWRSAFYSYRATEKGRSTGQGLLVDAAINVSRSAARAVSGERRQFVTTLSVRDRDGHVVVFDDYHGARASEEWVVTSIHQSAGNNGSPFEISAEGLVFDGKRITFASIDRVIITDEFCVMKVGVKSPWAATPLPRVRNPWRLVEQLLDHSVIVELEIDAPAAIVARARAVAETHEGLPRAVASTSDR